MVENDEVKVTLVETGDTPNLFVWEGNTLIAKIWLHPDGSIDYRSFIPKVTRSMPLRESQIQIDNDIRIHTPPKKKVPMRIKFRHPSLVWDSDSRNL